MACEPNTLLAEARCVCGLSTEQHLAIQTYLLCQIVAGGGGIGGSAQILVYTTTDPTTDGIFPSDTSRAAIAYQQGGAGPVFTWNTVTLSWS